MALFLFLVVILTTCFSKMDLHLLKPSSTTGGYCLDGSPAGYYLELSSNSSNVWVIEFEGGACYTYALCLERAQGNLGSSTHWSQSITGSDACQTKYSN